MNHSDQAENLRRRNDDTKNLLNFITKQQAEISKLKTKLFKVENELNNLKHK